MAALLFGLMTSAAVAAPPANDIYTAPQVVNARGTQLIPTSALGTTVEATANLADLADRLPVPAGGFDNEPVECFSDTGSSFYGATVWYEVNPDVGGRLTLTVGETPGDPVFRVIPLGAGDLVDAPNSLCVDATLGGGTERISFDARPGPYRVQIGAYRSCLDDLSPGCNPFTGQFKLTVDFRRNVDGDNLFDDEDICPTIAGPINGCLDSDGDGLIDPQDFCPNVNSSARDADRDGCLDVLRLASEPRLSFLSTRRGIKVRSLVVRNLPAGATVRINCTRRACRPLTLTAPSDGTLRVPAFRGKRLPARSKVIFRITLPDAVGVYFEYRILRGKFRRTERCLPPGSTRPQRTC